MVTTYNASNHTERYVFQDSGSSQIIIDLKNKPSIIAVCPAFKDQHDKAYQDASFITALLNAYDRGPDSSVSISIDETPNQKLLERNDDLEEAFHKIKNWCMAYPLDVFEEPDMDRAREVLKAGGINIGSVSAYCMRHVLKGIQEIIDPYITEKERTAINGSLS